MFARQESDAAVIQRVLRGDQGAFGVLVERYWGIVHGVAFSRLGNHAEAEDVTQEAFTRLYQFLDKIPWKTAIGPWLIHVARNASVDLLRKKGRQNAYGDLIRFAADGNTPNPGTDELHRVLMAELNALDADDREILFLRYFLHKRTREVAELLGISIDAAEKRVGRARHALGKRLVDLLCKTTGSRKKKQWPPWTPPHHRESRQKP